MKTASYSGIETLLLTGAGSLAKLDIDQMV